MGVVLSKIPGSGPVPGGQELLLREAQCPVLWRPAQAGGSFSWAAGVLRDWGQGALGLLGWWPQDAGVLVRQARGRQVGHSTYPAARSLGAGDRLALTVHPWLFYFYFFSHI